MKLAKNQTNSCCHTGCPPMIESLHFHRGYSLRLRKSKLLISYGIIRSGRAGVSVRLCPLVCDGWTQGISHSVAHPLWPLGATASSPGHRAYPDTQVEAP